MGGAGKGGKGAKGEKGSKGAKGAAAATTDAKGSKGTGKTAKGPEKGAKGKASYTSDWEAQGGKGKKGKDAAPAKGGKDMAKGAKGKDSSKGKGKSGRGKDAAAPFETAKTVQEIEAELTVTSRPSTRAAVVSKTPLEAKGTYCEVKKHSEIGCAVVAMQSEEAREAVMMNIPLKLAEEGKKGERGEIRIEDRPVEVRRHVDKSKSTEVKSDLFIAWGRQSEKASPLSCAAIAEAFDVIYQGVQSNHQAWGHDAMMMQQHQMLMSGAGARTVPQMMQQSYQMQMGMQQAYGYMDMAMQQQQHQAAAQAQQQQAAAAMAAHAAAAAAVQQASGAAQGQTSGNGMRADAPSFEQTAKTEMRADAPEFVSQNTDEYATPERKPLSIVNPKNGQPIEVEQPKPTKATENTTVEYSSPAKTPGPKKMNIVDPSSGNAIDTMGLNFSPPKKVNAFSIIDPRSGASIKAS